MALEIISVGNTAKSSQSPKTKKQQDIIKSPKQDRFDISTESLGGKIARNLYKPISSTISTLGGMPADVFNLLSGLTQKEEQKEPASNWFTAAQDWLSDVSPPVLPEWATSKGLRENITAPVGEAIFGVGSQEKQPGIMEDIIDRASEWAPYTLGAIATGGATVPGILGGLVLNLAQGAMGAGAKMKGLGETGQFLTEAATGGIGSLLGKVLRKKVPQKIVQSTAKELTSESKKAWENIREASKKAPRIPSESIQKNLLNAESKLINKIAPENRKGAVSLIQEVLGDVSQDKISPEKLVNARNKINNYYKQSLAKGTSGILGELKGDIDKALGESLGKIQQKGLDATMALKEFKKSSAYKTYVKPKESKSLDSAIKAVAKSPALLLGGAAYLLKQPAILAGAIGAQAYKNIEPLLSNPSTKKALLSAIGKSQASQAVKTGLKAAKTPTSSSPKGLEIISTGL
jgi:hypothetical protein